MYQSLLLSTGGGIISNVQKSIQDDAPVVVIGVGGTGAKALDTLKKKVYRQLQPDNPDDAIPKYEHIRFMEIDSDAEWMAGGSLDNDQEFVNLQDVNVRAKFENPVMRSDMLKKPQFQWLEAEKINIPHDLNGAGGIRQLGRYMIINSSQSVYTKIKNNISNAIAGRELKDLVIHIMAGISGGMGSGCFIDVCYIVRKVLQDFAADAATVFGYFFLPDVITTIPEIASDDKKITANYRNGYAALKELDYLMNLKENHGRFVQVYDGFSIDTNMEPVDMCHLVSALEASGNQKTDGFRYCMNVVADYVMSYLSKADGAGAITPKGSLANVNMGMNLLSVTKGAYNRYHVLGASNAEMPMRQVATYLATQLYEKMAHYLRKSPMDQDVVNFAENTMQLTIPELKRRLQKKVKMSREVPRPEISIPKAITASHVHSEHILKPMDDWLAEQIGTIERNYGGLDAAVSEYKRDENATALIGMLYNKLEDLALDSNYGPYYAIGMLSRIGKDLSVVLQGLHVEADRLTRQAEHQADFQGEQVEEAKQEFTSSRNTILHRNAENEAYDTYRGAIGIWYRRKLDAEMYRYVDKMIQGLQRKVEEMYHTFFAKLKNLLDGLHETFQENATYFAGGHGDDRSDDGFTIRIMKFSDIKRHLDDVLENERANDAAVSMVKYFLAHTGAWISGEENRINRMVNDFVLKRFQMELQKGMQQYIEEMYPDMNDPQQREQQLQNDLFLPLMNASEPLFWCSAAVKTEDTFSSISLSYPTASSDISSAVQNFKRAHPKSQLRGCEIQDRTFMLRLYSGMPLYGYHGLELMKERYDKAPKEGLHLYGKGESNWRSLPTPIPYSLNPAAVADGKRVEDAYKKAKEIGILKITTVVENGTEEIDDVILKKPVIEDRMVVELLEDLCCLGEKKETEDSKLSDLVIPMVREKYLLEEREFSYNKLNDWLKRVKKLKDDITQGKYDEYSVKHYKSETVALDNIIHSPVMTKVLLDTVELYDAAELGQARLKKLDEDIALVDKDIRDFSNALFTGILQQGIAKIFYIYVERHTEREAILASKTMTFANFLYYQAYVSFKDLAEGIKQDIIGRANEKINNLKEGDDAITLKIAQKCTPRDMADLERQYNNLREKDDIRNFYNKFLDLLYDYMDQFR